VEKNPHSFGFRVENRAGILFFYGWISGKINIWYPVHPYTTLSFFPLELPVPVRLVIKQFWLDTSTLVIRSFYFCHLCQKREEAGGLV
jgi:hypothetical protein